MTSLQKMTSLEKIWKLYTLVRDLNVPFSYLQGDLGGVNDVLFKHK